MLKEDRNKRRYHNKIVYDCVSVFAVEFYRAVLCRSGNEQDKFCFAWRFGSTSTGVMVMSIRDR